MIWLRRKSIEPGSRYVLGAEIANLGFPSPCPARRICHHRRKQQRQGQRAGKSHFAGSY